MENKQKDPRKTELFRYNDKTGEWKKLTIRFVDDGAFFTLEEGKKGGELLPNKFDSFCRGLLLQATLPYTGGHHTLLPLSGRKTAYQTHGYFLFCFSFLHIPFKFRCNPFRATRYVKNYFKKNFKNIKRLYPRFKKQGFSRLFFYKSTLDLK